MTGGNDKPLPPGWRPLRGQRQQPEPRRVGESIDRVARRLGAPPTSTLSLVFGRWAEAVGDTIAEHAKPTSLVDGVLTVVVDQPGWATQLRYLAPSIVERLAEGDAAGVVTRLEIKIGRR